MSDTFKIRTDLLQALAMLEKKAGEYLALQVKDPLMVTMATVVLTKSREAMQEMDRMLSSLQVTPPEYMQAMERLRVCINLATTGLGRLAYYGALSEAVTAEITFNISKTKTKEYVN